MVIRKRLNFSLKYMKGFFIHIFYSRLSRAKTLVNEKDLVSSVIADAEKTNLLFAFGNR